MRLSTIGLPIVVLASGCAPAEKSNHADPAAELPAAELPCVARAGTKDSTLGGVACEWSMPVDLIIPDFQSLVALNLDGDRADELAVVAGIVHVIPRVDAQPEEIVRSKRISRSYGSDMDRPVIADLDGDGTLDLGASFGSRLLNALHPGDGTGRFLPATPLFGEVELEHGRFTGFVDVVLGDVDGDGIQDLAGSFAAGAIAVARGDSAGSFALPAWSLEPFEEPARLVLAGGDVNGDARMDLVVSSGGALRSLLGRADGLLVPGPSVVADESDAPHAAHLLADLDGDGALDLLARRAPPGGPTALELFRGDGAGGFIPWHVFENDLENVVLCDMTGDGRDEVVQLVWTVSREQRLEVHALEAKGWRRLLDMPVREPYYSGALECGDFDGNGRSDLAWIEVTNNRARIEGMLIRPASPAE